MFSVRGPTSLSYSSVLRQHISSQCFQTHPDRPFVCSSIQVVSRQNYSSQRPTPNAWESRSTAHVLFNSSCVPTELFFNQLQRRLPDRTFPWLYCFRLGLAVDSRLDFPVAVLLLDDPHACPDRPFLSLKCGETQPGWIFLDPQPLASLSQPTFLLTDEETQHKPTNLCFCRCSRTGPPRGRAAPRLMAVSSRRTFLYFSHGWTGD